MKKILFIVLVLLLLGALFLSYFLYIKNSDLKNDIERQKEEYQLKKEALQNSFIDGNISAVSDEKTYFDTKKRLEDSGVDFIDVDLAKMKISLYENGREKSVFDVLTKGREGSWWETPTGEYSVISKSTNHFSSIGNVWMPWSIQFYGNFFIHGWPYHKNGTPVPESYSGGCVRLSSDDAKEIYEFSSRAMPILIYESQPSSTISVILPISQDLTPPQISGESAIIAELDSGEMLLNKNADMTYSIASITKLMTAVVGSELIYLERGIVISYPMMRDAIQSFPLEVGNEYKAFDLLYPMLMQSSNGSSVALSSFIGEGWFISQMNEKAKTLGMKSTVFTDTSGVDSGNISTLKDIARLAKYITEKRSFIFDITKGKKLSVFSEGELSGIKNFNEFANDPRLIGMKNGKTNEAGETILTVWNLKTNKGESHRIVIGVLKSVDREKDTTTLLSWLEVRFGLK